MHGDRPLSVAAAAGLVLVWLAVQVTPAGGFLSRKLQFHPGVGKRLASTADSQQTISAPLHESNSSLRTQPPNAPIEMTGGLSSERTVGHISARGSQVLTTAAGRAEGQLQVRNNRQQEQEPVGRIRQLASRPVTRVPAGLRLRGTSGVRGYNRNGTRLSHPECPAVFTGDGCRTAVHLPDCIDGTFRGQYFVLSKSQLLRTGPANVLLTRKGSRKLPQEIFKQVLAVLPDKDIFDASNPANRCALVGSDRGLQRSSFGGYIDEFDVVMRINGAPTAGFEAQVGSRTTHRFVNNAYVGWREGSEKLVSKWSGSVKQLVHYANQSTFVINPRFLSYSQSKYFSANKHLCTQGFRALLILLHTCRSVSVFGFTGTGGWYYDKRTNRRRSDKGKHTGEGQRLQGNSDSDSQSDEEGVLMPLWHGTPVENSESGSLPAKLLRDLPMHPRSLVASHGTTERRLRSLLATPSGHKLKYERTCLQRLVTYGAVRHHAMATKTAAVT